MNESDDVLHRQPDQHLIRTDLVLRKLICQTPTNRSMWQGLAQFDTMLVRRSTCDMAPKTDHPQPRFQSSTWFLKVPLRAWIAVRDFHGGRVIALVALFPLGFQPVHAASCRPPSPPTSPGAVAFQVGGGGSGDCQLLDCVPCNIDGGGPASQSGHTGVDHNCD